MPTFRNWFIRILILLPASPLFAQPAVRLADITAGSGIDFRHYDGRSGRRYITETIGSGAALFDYDNDGDMDVYLVNAAGQPGKSYDNPPRNSLYRNDGNLRFTDVTEEAGVDDAGYGAGCCAGDYDNDGDTDLYVTNYAADILYRNEGDGTFTDVTAAAGLGNGLWGVGCLFADFDVDGDLDLYVANYLTFDYETAKPCLHGELIVYCDPTEYDGLPDVFYRNNGDGTFSDVTRAAGLFNPAGRGLGCVAGDVDNDGLVDLYVANDLAGNFLYRNLGGLRFEEITLEAGVGYSEDGQVENGMGTNMGDYDNDGLIDIVVTNFQDQTTTLYHNDGDCFFTDVTSSTGLAGPSLPLLSWGVDFVDLDNDGRLEIFIASGHLHDNVAQFDPRSSYPMRHQIFKQDRSGRFQDATAEFGPVALSKRVSRGAAFGDLDNDGDLDMVINNCDEGDSPSLLLNEGGNKAGNWIGIELTGTECNRSAIGARVTVTAGDLRQIREVKSGSGYASQNDLRLLFGLGANTTCDQIEILWPGGQKQTLPPGRVNRYVTIKQQ
ncbi:CRTAC1 family protein [candidate division KSB1 bacterium]